MCNKAVQTLISNFYVFLYLKCLFVLKNSVHLHTSKVSSNERENQAFTYTWKTLRKKNGLKLQSWLKYMRQTLALV